MYKLIDMKNKLIKILLIIPLSFMALFVLPIAIIYYICTGKVIQPPIEMLFEY